MCDLSTWGEVVQCSDSSLFCGFRVYILLYLSLSLYQQFWIKNENEPMIHEDPFQCNEYVTANTTLRAYYKGVNERRKRAEEPLRLRTTNSGKKMGSVLQQQHQQRGTRKRREQTQVEE